jgi:cytochrome c biogenesis protein CcdA
MKTKLLKIVNPLLGLTLLTVLVVLGFLKFGDVTRTLVEIHEIAGIVLIFLLIAHIYLNFKWFANLFKKKKK